MTQPSSPGWSWPRCGVATRTNDSESELETIRESFYDSTSHNNGFGPDARPRVGHPGGIERQPDAVLERFAARTSNADANVGQLGLSVTLH